MLYLQSFEILLGRTEVSAIFTGSQTIATLEMLVGVRYIREKDVLEKVTTGRGNHCPVELYLYISKVQRNEQSSSTLNQYVFNIAREKEQEKDGWLMDTGCRHTIF